MRKSLLIVYLTFVFSFFIFTVGHTAGNLGKSEVSFSKGLLAYNQKQYASAAQHFTKAFTLDPKNNTAAYYAGLCHYHQDHLTEALTHFQKAIATRDESGAPHLYSGIIYFRRNQNERAIDEFQKAKTLAVQESVRDLSMSYLRRLGVEQTPSKAKNTNQNSEKPWFAFGSFTTQFDSNVSLDPSNLTVTSLPSDQTDITFLFQLGGGYRFINRPKYRFTAEAAYNQSLYTELNDFNYSLIHSALKPELKIGKLFLEAPVYYDYALLAGEKYVQTVGVNPMGSYVWSKHFVTSLSPKIRYDDFFQGVIAAAQNRDAVNLQLDFTQYYFFDKNQKTFVTVGYNLESNLDTGSDWEYMAHSVSTSFSSPLFWDLQLYLLAKYTIDKDFENADSIIGTRRNDWAISTVASVSRKLFGPVSASASYSFFKNSSNQGFFEYNKHVAGLTLSVSY